MNKFIINDNTLIIGDVQYHNELLKKHELTIGGGYFEIDLKMKIVLLYGYSSEFGSVSFDDIKKVIEEENIPRSLIKFNFYFSVETELDKAIINKKEI
jgi:hypothetical protein